MTRCRRISITYRQLIGIWKQTVFAKASLVTRDFLYQYLPYSLGRSRCRDMEYLTTIDGVQRSTSEFRLIGGEMSLQLSGRLTRSRHLLITYRGARVGYYMCISCGQHDSHTQPIAYPDVCSQSCQVIKPTTFTRICPLTTFSRIAQPWLVL